jgi:hypothetical protein
MRARSSDGSTRIEEVAMNNIIAFRHPAVSPAQAQVWPNLRRSSGAFMPMPRRRVLVAAWRLSAADGRLECRWRSESGECRDEDGSRRSRRRCAA